MNYEIKRVSDFKGVKFFDIVINGVTIYGCKVATTKSGKKFISFPSRKGNDGKYYNHAYIKLEESTISKILDELETR